MKRIINFIRKIFALKCPNCGANLKIECYEMTRDCIVYKCHKCGKEWI